MTQAAATRTTCPYCGVGCGVLAAVRNGAVDIAGDPDHPANFGRLCVKGTTLGETVDLTGRLLHPFIREAEGGRREATWDEALDRVAGGFRSVIEKHGPDAVAFYVSGQLLTEDYYVANKLMKGFIGSANIDTNSRLCMSSAVVGHKRAFGADLVPVSYADLELADLLVLVGSNTAWCHPILHQRMLRGRRSRGMPKIVVIDPRHTATVAECDLHLPVRPGTDVWLFNGLLAFLHEHGLEDTAFTTAHAEGLDRAVAVAKQTSGSIAHVAKTCGVAEEKIREFYQWFARTERVVTAFSQGVNQSSAGVDKVNSLINCHLLTGRIGKPGLGPFSITGQPNAMGGREVGGLATMLAAHLEIENPEHRGLVQTFWNSPRVPDTPGLKAVDLFRAVGEGKIKALWIMATNPVVSLPDANAVRTALKRCELVVISDLMADTDTAALAHVWLPASGWGEKDGTVTNSERRISRVRAFLPPPGEARPDWWIATQVARRMGYADAFPYESAHEVFVEHARLSAFRNASKIPALPPLQKGESAAVGGAGEFIPRLFNLSGLADLSAEDYDALQPVQWPVPEKGSAGTVRLFGDGRFQTPSGRARLVAVWPRPPAHAPDDEYPLVLNSGRIRDQWHTMSRSGKSPRLAGHLPEPFVEIHPHDAMLWGVRDGQLARVSSRWGTCVLSARVLPDVPRRMLFVPIHWNDQNASDARIGALVNPVVDPLSGEPEFKHTPARIEPFSVDWYGFALTRRPLAMKEIPAAAWWVRIQGPRFLRYELAGRGTPDDWSVWARRLLDVPSAEADWLDASDASEGVYRAAHLYDGHLDACLCVSPRPEDLPARAWLSALFERERIAPGERVALLAGGTAHRADDPGMRICACFGVGRNTILRAVRERGCTTVEALGAALKCGTNCGSCLPDLRVLIQEARATTV
ncbi:MAG: molybdopterin-dependent oxidoreductase [Nevskiales bacterium]|nr:molybdopterin-dependent oxidoreductase [Nevskiales bacterium]